MAIIGTVYTTRTNKSFTVRSSRVCYDININISKHQGYKPVEMKIGNQIFEMNHEKFNDVGTQCNAYREVKNDLDHMTRKWRQAEWREGMLMREIRALHMSRWLEAKGISFKNVV